MSVTATNLPSDSALHSFIHAGDFVDCYACPSDLSVEDAALAMTKFPGWANILLVMRNVLVGPFGLKTGTKGTAETMGIFPVDQRLENEILLGMNDKHLDFRISICKRGTQIFTSTWVHRNNIFGAAYLTAIMPFHIIIIRDAMRRMERMSQSSA